MPDEVPDRDEEYVLAKISQVGFVDPQGQEGVVILKTFEGKEFPMRAFSGEVARHILRFREGDKNSIPTIYNLVEEIAVIQDLLLMEVRVYQSGSVLRANLYFKSRKDNLVLRKSWYRVWQRKSKYLTPSRRKITSRRNGYLSNITRSLMNCVHWRPCQSQ